MKFSMLSAGLALVSAVLAAPASTEVDMKKRSAIGKRATIADVAITGFATLNGGTTGGKGGATITVSSYAQLAAAAAGDTPRVIIVSGTITKDALQVQVGSNKSIIGKDSNAKLIGFGLLILGKKNVIVRNLTIQKVLARNGDAIGIQKSTNVWVDHVDLSSDRDHDKDFYDGLIDITHAGDFVTISNSYLHDHWKALLIGHDDANGAEDTGHLRVTLHNNFFDKVHSRLPSIRFGHGHVFNNHFLDSPDGINTRQGAQLLVQSNVFSDIQKPIYADAGYAIASDNIFSGKGNNAPTGTLKTVPYNVSVLSCSEVIAAVNEIVGATLSF